MPLSTPKSVTVEAMLATMVAQSSVSVEMAMALAREHYGLETTAVRLSGERDENFLLRTGQEVEYLLKVAHPLEDEAVTDLLGAALEYLESRDAGLPCPRLVPSSKLYRHVRLTDASGVERQACLLTYLSGQTLEGGSRSARQRAACGRIAGRLSEALRGFEHSAAHRPLIWDLGRMSAMVPVLAQLPGFRYRRAALDLIERILPNVNSFWPTLRQQIVHNDLNPRNVLVDPADETHITGIIDFGDMLHTALIADVAVTAAELLPETCSAGEEARSCIRDVALAYEERQPLLVEERSVLGTLVAARLVMNVVVQEWHVQRNPGGGHYQALDLAFIRSRLQIAAELLSAGVDL